MLYYNSKFYFPPTDTPRGVGVHPHRGFETVTIAYSGKVEHHDSGGNHGVISEGDVQWMTAASGILHKEYHEKEFAKAGGDFQMVQLWVNLPAKDKMSKPKYQEIANGTMGKVNLPDDAGNIDVIAGKFGSTKGPASTFTPVNLMNAKLNKGGKTVFSFPSNYNTSIVVIEGTVKVNGNEAIANSFVLLANDGEEFVVEATEQSIILVMSGEPILEPIAAHGPFVMNTREEIIQAVEDYNRGKFGVLAD
jgi:redox-sensitive bicupin YhaK (pirin superfamily)